VLSLIAYWLHCDVLNAFLAKVSLADPQQLFDAVRANAVEFDCGASFLSTLQHLLLIPAYDGLGKRMWASVESSVHGAIVPADQDEAELTLANVHAMLGWKERLEELSMEAAEATSSATNLKAKVRSLHSDQAMES
jgi:hypothetical protein